MDYGGDAAVDQSSGWFEVKKKHRNNSKYPLQSWVGGLSGKRRSQSQRSQASFNEKSGNVQGKQQYQPQKSTGDSHDQSNVAASSKDVQVVSDFKKFVANQDAEHSKSPHVYDTNSASIATESQESPEDEKVCAVKIKWGDLDDDVLSKSAGVKIKFGNIEDDNLNISMDFDNNCHPSKSGISSSSSENKSTKSQDEKKDTEISSAKKDDVLKKSSKKLDGTFSKDVKNSAVLVGNQYSVPTEDSMTDEIEKVIISEVDSSKNSAIPVGNNSSALDEEVMPDTVQIFIQSEVDLEDSVIPAATGSSGTDVFCPDVNSFHAEKSGHKILEESISEAIVGDGKVPDILCDGKLNVQNMDFSVGTDVGESKERFRERLWCFLFENINRAVDELYLLCELECDIEQMNEAILVLAEASSDFKELKTRVEDFEGVKSSSSQMTDGASITLKSNHRRPHALSWEVRRMTTSPHKAEILSSSLEAFKKIQQERASSARGENMLHLDCLISRDASTATGVSHTVSSAIDPTLKNRKHGGGGEKSLESGRYIKGHNMQNGGVAKQHSSSSDMKSNKQQNKDICAASVSGKGKRELGGSETEKLLSKKDRTVTETSADKTSKSIDHLRRRSLPPEKDIEKRISSSWRSMDAWKEKRNWEDILSSPYLVSSRISHSPGLSRKSADRARILHDKLMSPEKKKKTAVDLKKEAEEKHARALRIRAELESERMQKFQRTSEKLNRVNEWQAVRSMKLREGMYARHQRSESRHEAYIAQVVRRAGDQSSKVNEVRFITSLNEENKKLSIRQKLHDSEMRRAEKLQVLRAKQKEDMAREEAALERRKLMEAEKLQRLAEIQRRKEEAQLRREEERKASSVAREARAIEQQRRKEERAKAQQEEAELLAQKLAERLRESEQRRKFYLEQIRERASMDFRDQSSPLVRQPLNKEDQCRSLLMNNGEDSQSNNISVFGGSLPTGNFTLQHPLKRKIKRIRQRLMSLKYEFLEPPIGAENANLGYRTAVGTARARFLRWIQELQRLRQARKEGAASIGLIIADMIKFMDGKDPELQASRQAGLLDFIASALPASHTSKPEACHVTIHLLKLLKVVLSSPANRSYFLAQNLLPPIIPMLSAALENYIKVAASLNSSSSANLSTSKTSFENFELISEVLDGFLWTLSIIIGHISSDERQLQMRDGLLELLIAYQIIHRLRDLFALYDRPQTEGSPFPSSILLSIHLLEVLTSRPENASIIDWELFASGTAIETKNQEYQLTEFADSECDLDNLCGDGSSLLVLNKSTLPEDRLMEKACEVDKDGESALLCKDDRKTLPEDRLMEKACELDKDGESALLGKDDRKKLSDSSAVLATDNFDKRDSLAESRKNMIENTAKICLHQKDEKQPTDIKPEQKKANAASRKSSITFLLNAISETGLISLPSLLTAVLLQANNKLSSEQTSYVLPTNFEEVATGVLKVLNNLALLDIIFLQETLARPDLKMEFFHLLSFLLSHCSSRWKVASDQVGLLLIESLMLLGNFSLFHPGNQAVLRWGKSPTILHKVCDLPFSFFSDPELMPVMAGTLVAACYGCEQNKGVVQLELSTDMLLSLLNSCRNSSPPVRSRSNMDNPQMSYSNECNPVGSELKKLSVDNPLRSSRYNVRSGRTSLGKGGASGSSIKMGKPKNQRDCKSTKSIEEITVKDNLDVQEAPSMMLHCRFPSSFIDKAEQYFSCLSSNVSDQL